MKYLLILFSLLFSALLSAETKKDLLIINEIRKSIAQDFKLKAELKEIDGKVPKPNPKYIPKKKVKKVVEKKIVKKKTLKKKVVIDDNKKRGLLEPDGSPFDSKKSIFDKKKNKRSELKRKKAVKKNNSPFKKWDNSSLFNNDITNKNKGGLDSNWMSNKNNENNQWFDKKKSEIESWEKEKKAILNSWYKSRKRYLKEIPQYKKTLTPLPLPSSAARKSFSKNSSKIKLKKINKNTLSNYFYIKGAFIPKIKDQGRRPTCASFAAIRSLEILMAQDKKYTPLSEQYFYWASKPKCQSSPCNTAGSWVYNGFLKSKLSADLDIPSDKSCPYNASQKSGNETQIPLQYNCQQGRTQVKSFYEVKSFNQVIAALKNNNPVVGAFKLNQSFYKNVGYIFANDPRNPKAKLDSHAAGHAILLIGYMKLPKKLHKSEGKFCLFTANSWGKGWGKGGHACLSKKWFDKYRYDIPFIAAKSLKY